MQMFHATTANQSYCLLELTSRREHGLYGLGMKAIHYP